MKEANNIIYVLVDPRTGEFRYIGMTRFGLSRPKMHSGLAENGERSHKANWIRQLHSLDLEYEVEVLEILLAIEDLPLAEIKWISCYRGMGARLTNATDGGEGMLNPLEDLRSKLALGAKESWTPERGVKLAEVNRAREYTPEDRARLSAAQKKRYSDPCEREKAAATQRGKKATPEARANMSKAQLGNQHSRGRKHPPETRAKMSAAQKKRWTPELRAISATVHKTNLLSDSPNQLLTGVEDSLPNKRRGRRQSAETKAKISEKNKGKKSSMRGKKHTPETRFKIAQARRAYNARLKNAIEQSEVTDDNSIT